MSLPPDTERPPWDDDAPPAQAPPVEQAALPDVATLPRYPGKEQGEQLRRIGVGLVVAAGMVVAMLAWGVFGAVYEGKGAVGAEYMSWIAWAAIALALIVGLFLFRDLRRLLAIRGTPTSKIRDARPGPAELVGTAIPLYQLDTPFGRNPCVAYRYKIKERRTHRRNFRTREYWVTVKARRSGPAPFLLDDGTGRVRVEPEGASLHCTARDEALGGEGAFGAPRIAHETYIPVGSQVYVLGELSRSRTAGGAGVDRLRALKADPAAMAQLDLDGDGRVDAEEWERGRAALEQQQAAEPGAGEPVGVVSAGKGRVPFLIAGDSEKTIAARVSLAVVLEGLAVAGAAGYAIWHFVVVG